MSVSWIFGGCGPMLWPLCVPSQPRFRPPVNLIFYWVQADFKIPGPGRGRAGAGLKNFFNTGAGAGPGLTKTTYTGAGAGFVEKYRVSTGAGAGLEAPVGS